jgi:hypothetical protein
VLDYVHEKVLVVVDAFLLRASSQKNGRQGIANRHYLRAAEEAYLQVSGRCVDASHNIPIKKDLLPRLEPLQV